MGGPTTQLPHPPGGDVPQRVDRLPLDVHLLVHQLHELPVLLEQPCSLSCQRQRIEACLSVGVREGGWGDAGVEGWRDGGAGSVLLNGCFLGFFFK